MKLHERINFLLIGTLWCLAVVLVLDFWLNTMYHFNLFSSRHWHVVAELQAANKPVFTGFYVSLTVAVLVALGGLFVLLRPKFRKIIFKASEKPVDENTLPVARPVPPVPQTTEQPEPVAKVEPVAQSTPIIPVPEQASEPVVAPAQKPTETVSSIERPPHLHIQPSMRVATPKKQMPEPKPEPKPATVLYATETREIFEKNGYRVLQPKPVAGIPLSLIALGTNETLWLGACEVSHEQMADAILAFKSIFQETLEDIEIDINAFIINPTDNDEPEGILNFKSILDLADAIKETPNEPESAADAESGNMDAFVGYIETVLTYLEKK
ncbi:MAG: hypothetical protein J5608_00425 [Alphaproteobacteria bacterium]|nr:hypothetical protein [Alphaproteobacteria bacterium]